MRILFCAVALCFSILRPLIALADSDEQDFVSAACRGDTKLVSLYTRLPGLNVNFVSDGETALTCAARNMKWPTVVALLQAKQVKYDLTIQTAKGDQFLHWLPFAPEDVLHLVASINHPNQFDFFAKDANGNTIFERSKLTKFSIGKIADLNEVDPSQKRYGRNLLEEAIFSAAGSSAADLARTGKFDLMNSSLENGTPLLPFAISRCAWEDEATIAIGIIEGAKKQGLRQDFFEWHSPQDSKINLFSLVPMIAPEPCGNIVRALLSNYSYPAEYLQPQTTTDVPICEKLMGDEDILQLIDKAGALSIACKYQQKGQINLASSTETFRCEDLKGNSAYEFKDQVTGYVETLSSSGGECSASGICYEATLGKAERNEFKDRKPGDVALWVIKIQSSLGENWKIPYWSEGPNEFEAAEIIQLSVSPNGRIFVLLNFPREYKTGNGVIFNVYEFSPTTGHLKFLKSISNLSNNSFTQFATTGGLIFYNKPHDWQRTYISTVDGLRNMTINQILLPYNFGSFGSAEYVRLRQVGNSQRLIYMSQNLKTEIDDCRYSKQEWVYDATAIVDKMNH